MSDALFSASSLSRLSHLPREAVERKLADVPAQMKGKRRVYKLADALPKLCLGSDAEELATRTAELRHRKAQVESDLADIALAQRIGDLVFKRDAQHLIKNVLIRTRTAFQNELRSGGYTAAQQARMVEIYNEKIAEKPEF